MQNEPTFKGNESSCICEKPKGRHKKHCDAYRLSEFLLKASLPMQNEPQKYVDTICSMRHGSADEKQFRATVEHNIATALEEQKEKYVVHLRTFLTETGGNDELSIGFEAGIKAALALLTQQEGAK